MFASRAELADADATLLLATGRLRNLATLTANRAYTLSNTGAVEGDTITIERTSTAHFKARINNAAGTQIFVMARPGTFIARFTAGAWVRSESDIGHGFRRLSPYEFGAIGDGVADDTDAVQAMFDALSGAGSEGFNGQVEIPHGCYLITETIDIAGDVFKSLRITGDVGGSAAFQGCRFQWGGAASGTMFMFRGMQSVVLEHLEFRCSSLAKYGVVLTWLADDGTGPGPGCQNCLFYRCSFYAPRDVAGAACIALGPTGIYSRQTSECSFTECTFLGNPAVPDYLTYQASGIITRQGGNTKNFSATNCKFLGFAYAIDWDLATGQFNVQGCNFGYCGQADVRASGGVMVLTSCESEGSRKIATGTAGGGSGSLTIIGHDWNGETDDEDTVCDYPLSLSIKGSTFLNGRFLVTVTGSAAANTLTAVAHGYVDGDRFQVFNVDGAMPRPLQLNTYYEVFEKTDDTFKVSADGGLTAVDLLTDGSGTIWAFSPSIVRPGDCTDTSQTGGSLTSEGNWYCGASEFAPFRDTNENLLLQVSYPTTLLLDVSSRYDYGGFAGRITRLRNTTGSSPQNAHIQSYAAAFSELSSRVILGAVNDGWHSWEIRPEHMVASGTTHQIAVFLPQRTFLSRIILDTPTAFDGPATVTAKAYETTASPADLILVHDIKAIGRKGLVDADLGALIDAAAALPNGHGYMPTAGWSAQWFFYVDIVGASALTACTVGKLRILMRTERAP